MPLVCGTRCVSAFAVAVLCCCALTACGGGNALPQQATNPTPSSNPAPAPGPTTNPSSPGTTLSIDTSQLPIGDLQQPYTASLSASGSNGAVKWSVLSGALPAGVSLAGDTGALSGTPTAAGVFNVSIQAADSGSSVSRALTMHVSGNGTYYHQYTKPGTYNVRVTTVDSQGNITSATQTVVIGSN